MDEQLAKDLLTLWQSELTALAVDREIQEGWTRLVQLWAHIASVAASLLPHDAAPGGTAPAQPPWPAAADAASGAGLAETRRLLRRIAELEQQLAEHVERERAARPAGADLAV